MAGAGMIDPRGWRWPATARRRSGRIAAMLTLPHPPGPSDWRRHCRPIPDTAVTAVIFWASKANYTRGAEAP